MNHLTNSLTTTKENRMCVYTGLLGTVRRVMIHVTFCILEWKKRSASASTSKKQVFALKAMIVYSDMSSKTHPKEQQLEETKRVHITIEDTAFVEEQSASSNTVPISLILCCSHTTKCTPCSLSQPKESA